MKMSIKILAAKKAKKQVSFRAFFKKNMYFCTETVHAPLPLKSFSRHHSCEHCGEWATDEIRNAVPMKVC